jgi:hypothetical protein
VVDARQQLGATDRRCPQLRKPADMSARIAGDKRRAVSSNDPWWPLHRRRPIGVEHGANTVSSSTASANRSKNVGDLFVGAVGQRRERIDRACHRRRHELVFRLRDVQQIAVVLHDHQTVAGCEDARQLGRHHGDLSPP